MPLFRNFRQNISKTLDKTLLFIIWFVILAVAPYLAKGPRPMKTAIVSLLKDESGATAIEYGLIAALVSVAGITALDALGTSLTNMFTTVSSEISSAVTSASSGG